MLIQGETFNQRKWSILDHIKVSRKLIKQANASLKTLPELKPELFELIEVENKAIADLLKDLQALERWRIAHDYPKNQPYISEEAKKRRDAMTPEEMEAYLDRMMELDEQIILLEQKLEVEELERGVDAREQLPSRQVT